MDDQMYVSLPTTPSRGGFMFDSIVGGALNAVGAHMANTANRKMAREQMKFQRESNREQMSFQERMSNTAYQRSMADMEKAGLNPILAYNQGGASSPSGSAGAGSTATMTNEMSGAVSSALDAKRLKYEVDNLKEQNSLIRDQASANRASAAKTLSEMYLAEDQRELTKANTAKSLAEVSKIKSDTVRQWVDTVGNQINPLKLLDGRLPKFKSSAKN